MKRQVLTYLTLLFISACGTKIPVRTTVTYSDRVISVAEPFAEGVISSSDKSEFSIMFSPNGLKAYFSRGLPYKNEKQKIYETNFENGKWSSPILCKFSTDRDEEPSITPNGELFFFGSERPIPNKPNLGNYDMNIWMMKREGNDWSEPKPLPFPINDVQIKGEGWPSSVNNFLFPVDNETFYYTTMVRGTDAIKLYETKYINNEFTKPVEINGLFDDAKYRIYSAVVSPDGKYLVFNSVGVPESLGGEDIFISKRTKSGWSKAKGVGDKVNSKDEESGPRFSRDGKYFFFSKAKYLGNGAYGEWDIFYIETKYLNFEALFND